MALNLLSATIAFIRKLLLFLNKSLCSCFVSQGMVTGLDFLIMQLPLISLEAVIFRLLIWTCNLIPLKL